MKKKVFIGISYFYVAFPVAIFFLGWVKPWISIPLCVLLVYACLKALSLDLDLWIPEWSLTNIIKGIVILLLITLWVYSSGIGNLVFQNGDHAYRNAIYECLVNNPWPIIKDVVFEDNTQLRILTYYIGFWLPAAIIGKIFGIACGYIFQFIWAILGVTIGAILINSFMKEWSVWPIAFFIMFSGMDALGYILLGNLDMIMSFEHIEWWSGFQFSSFRVLPRKYILYSIKRFMHGSYFHYLCCKKKTVMLYLYGVLDYWSAHSHLSVCFLLYFMLFLETAMLFTQ